MNNYFINDYNKIVLEIKKRCIDNNFFILKNTLFLSYKYAL